jgi:putative ABC transport system substrate-binding protein
VIRGLPVFALVILIAYIGPFGLASAADSQQQVSPRRIGVVLMGLSPEGKEAGELVHGLRDAGYVVGRDVVIEWRSADGDYGKVAGLVNDLVQSKVDVIVADSTPVAAAAARATSAIPIVMADVGDPVGSGLVSSLAHPGGNITGLSLMAADVSTKRLQLLKETIPQVARVAVVWNQHTPWHKTAVDELKTVAPMLSITVSFVSAREPADLNAASSAIHRAHAEALYVLESAFFVTQHRKKILAIASKSRRHARVGADRIADGLAVELGFGEESPGLLAHPKPETGQFRVPYQDLVGSLKGMLLHKLLGELGLSHGCPTGRP